MPQNGTKGTTDLIGASLWLTSTDEVDNLDPIVIVQHTIRPLTPAHHFAVELNRNSRGRQIKLFD